MVRNIKFILLFCLCFLSIFLFWNFYHVESKKIPAIAIKGDLKIGTWESHVIDHPNRQNGSLGIGDLDNDGLVDVVIALGNRNDPQPTDGIYWYQSPNWKFRRLSDPAYPVRWSLSLTTGDVDNDGDLDVVALSFDLSKVYLAINPGNDEVFKPWSTIVVKDSSESHRDGERVELVDIDKDGYKDIVFPRGQPKEIRVLFNPSGKVYNRWDDKLIGVHAGADAHDVLAADIDKDGDLDIVAASGGGTPGVGAVYWYEHPDNNARRGIWHRHKISSVSTNYAGLQIDDIDKDGWQDIFVTSSHGNPGEVMWYKNPGPSSQEWQLFVIDVQFAPHAALAFDVDGDGENEFWVPDSACCNSDIKGGIVIYKPIDASKNQWEKHEVASTPQLCRQSRAVDMDLDGDLDVVCEAANNNLDEPRERELIWWENKTNS